MRLKIAWTARFEGLWLAARSPAGGQSLGVYHRVWYWGQYVLTFPLRSWMMGQRVPSVSVQKMTEQKWLTHHPEWPALADHTWAGGWTRSSPEIPSHLSDSVCPLLFKSTESVYFPWAGTVAAYQLDKANVYHNFSVEILCVSRNSIDYTFKLSWFHMSGAPLQDILWG